MSLRFALEIERNTVDYLLKRFNLTRADIPPINMLNN